MKYGRSHFSPRLLTGEMDSYLCMSSVTFAYIPVPRPTLFANCDAVSKKMRRHADRDTEFLEFRLRDGFTAGFLDEVRENSGESIFSKPSVKNFMQITHRHQ
jgi:hypothetical protein